MSILQNLRAIFQANAANTASEPTPVDKLAADLGHYDGHIREAALRRAAGLASPQLLPAIAERLNDWVPQVRTLAQEVLLGMLASIGKDEALRLLPAVQRLHNAGRADHSAWIARFERALIERVGAQAIVDGLLDPDVHVARACWRLAEAAGLASAEEVIARLLPATTDIVLARHAVEAIFKLDEPARQPLFRRALASSFGMVRAIALRPLLAEQSEENDALAIRMLSDLQSWVRLIASGYLARRGIDPGAILAENLGKKESSSRELRASLAGLAELGRTDKLDLVRSFTRHPVARVQIAAYLAWLRLEPARKDRIALDLLRGPHRRVRKLVLHLVREDGVYLDTGTALALMAGHDDVDMMLAFVKGQPWSWVELIVQLEPRSRQDPALRAHLTKELLDWIGRSGSTYAKPGEAQRVLFQKEETRQALEALLPPHDQMNRWILARELQQTG